MSQRFQEEVDKFIMSKSSRLKDVYPSQGAHLFSAHTIPLKKEHLETIRNAIRGFFAVRNALAHAKANYSSQAKFQPPNYSLFMSYDFHITESGPKLIEINTNAGQSLYVDAIYKFKNEATDYLEKPFTELLRESFFEEARLCKLSTQALQLAITDDKPQQQFFYPEFLMMADLAESWGWTPRTCGAEVLKWNGEALMCGSEKIDFVYNRLTDFYLQEHLDLRKAYEAGVCLSPNPHEYDLLANKSRLIEFSEPGKLNSYIGIAAWQKACESVLTETLDVRTVDHAELWGKRKKFFFKPKTSFAGKGAYRGENIQRKVFDDLVTRDYIAQEFIRAPELDLKENGVDVRYKYDIRVYAYQDQVQLLAARIYRGQVTNFRAEGSGVCTVKVI